MVDTTAAAPLLGIRPTSRASQKRAEAIAEELYLPCLMGSETELPDFELLVSNDRLALQPNRFASGPIGIDFTAGRAMHRLKFGGGKRQPLARAIGLASKSVKKNQALSRQNPGVDTHSQGELTVFDATAGFGKDTWVMASLGCRVIAAERCLWLHWMLNDALELARDDDLIADIARRIKAVHHDSRDLKCKDLPWSAADVVYLDPMYPPSQKSAAVKKEMQALHYLLAGQDERASHNSEKKSHTTEPQTDAENAALLQSALGFATQRVVVKRPARALPLVTDAVTPGNQFGNPATTQAAKPVEPDTSIKSVNTRYDIYIVKH